MIDEAAERVTAYLLETVGGDLRTVVVVTGDGYAISYLNEEMRRQYSRETFAEVVESFRLEEPFLAPGIEGSPIGERRAIVHYHENAFVLQFPYTEAETILISVTREVGRDLLGFIEKCRELVRPEG